MKTGFFERTPSNHSMMRLLAFLGFILGGIVVVWGMVLLSIVIMKVVNGADPFVIQATGSLVMLVSGGLALAAGGQAMKVVQQRSESREQQITQIPGGGVNESKTVDVENSSSLSSGSAGGGGL
jgi:hypothetical protein